MSLPERYPERSEELLRVRARQQAAVARLGQRALAGIGLDTLFDEAVREVHTALGVDYTKVLELLPYGDDLLLRAGVGWKPGWVGNRTVSAGRDSQAGYTLLSEHPVITHDLPAETRFTGPALLLEHGVVSGISVIIGSRERPWGVFGAHMRSRRRFTDDDVSFLQSVANVLASAIDRTRAESDQRFLGDVSDALAVALDHEASLVHLGHLVVPKLADFCLIDVVEDGDEVRRVTAVHRDPARESLMREVAHYSPDPQASPVARALLDAEARLIRDVTDETMTAFARDERHRRAIRALKPRSVMLVPLVARGRTLGIMTLVATEAHRGYTERDLALARDVARRAAIAVDNARLYEAAQAASRAKSEFLATMSHELRTPLTAIVGFADLLEAGIAGALTEQQLQHVRRMRASAYSLRDLIDEILTFSKLESDRERPATERVDVALLARESADLAESAVADKGLHLELDIPDSPVEAITDPAKVRHVLLNLLNNSVAFTEEGAVRLAVRAHDDTIAFEVADTGIGIAPEDLDRIFEPFWQAERGLTRRVGGTGLGLTIARRLTNMIGGEITVESEVGHGSTFRVTIPRSPPAAAVEGSREPRRGGER